MPVTDSSQPSTFAERDDWMRAVLKSKLSHVSARVAVRIALHLNVEFGRCDPGVGKIATGSMVSERSVYRQLALLEQAGWIAIRSGGGRKRSNHYILKYPDTVPSGFNSENPVSGDTQTLSAATQNPATKVADKKSLKAKRTGRNAFSVSPGEREERSLALADIPGAPAPSGGAPKEKFDALWALWSSHRNFPDTDEDEAAAWKAYVAIVPGEASPGELHSRAEAHIAGVKANGLKLGDLCNWLSRNNWRKEPAPPPKPKRNAGKVSLSDIALAATKEGGDQ